MKMPALAGIFISWSTLRRPPADISPASLAHGCKANALGFRDNLLRQEPCSLTFGSARCLPLLLKVGSRVFGF